MKFPDSKTLIFCKAPIPGTVKTRLHSVLSEEQAAELHIKLATSTIELAIKSQLCPVEIWCSPDITHAFFQRFDLSLRKQQGRDLGERMHNAFHDTLMECSSSILIGTDCPSLTINNLSMALTKLKEGKDVVIAPAEDGGYSLIGLNKNYRTIFDSIDWGTSNVLKQTRNKINSLGLSLYELPLQWDVDRTEDLQRYIDSQTQNI